MNDEKIFVGNGKEIQTQYGPLLKLSFSAEDVEKLQQNLENGWVNVTVKKRREPSERGTTHYLEVDKWKPTPQGDGSSAAASAPKPAKAPIGEEVSPEDLPF